MTNLLQSHGYDLSFTHSKMTTTRRFLNNPHSKQEIFRGYSRTHRPIYWARLFFTSITCSTMQARRAGPKEYARSYWARLITRSHLELSRRSRRVMEAWSGSDASPRHCLPSPTRTVVGCVGFRARAARAKHKSPQSRAPCRHGVPELTGLSP